MKLEYKITRSRGVFYIKCRPVGSTSKWESGDDGFFNTRDEAKTRINQLKR